MYTIKFKHHDQDNVNFFDCRFDELNLNDDSAVAALEYSLSEGILDNPQNIKCFCDGGDHIEPYFTSLTPAEEVDTYIDFELLQRPNEMSESLEFDEEKKVYDFFY